MLAMPAYSRKETERRLKLMAVTLVQQEMGLYEWPDGRKPTRPNGEPVISFAECIRLAGYSDKRSSKARAVWQNDPYFRRQYELAKARASEREVITGPPVLASGEVIATAGKLLELGERMVDEAIFRLKHDPASFTNNQLVSLGPQVMAQAVNLMKDKAPPPSKSEVGMPTQNAFLGDVFVNMNELERENFQANAEQAREQRMARLKQQMDALAAKEEADDPDVIDAEISPESS
jgi:hypothetical protein